MGFGMNSGGVEKSHEGMHSATAVWLKSRGIIAEALVELTDSYNKNMVFNFHTEQAVRDACRHNAAAIIARLAQRDLLIVAAGELGRVGSEVGSESAGESVSGNEGNGAEPVASVASGESGAAWHADHTFRYTFGVFIFWLAMIFGTSWFMHSASALIPGWVYVPMACMLTGWSFGVTLWTAFVVMSFIETFGKGK